MPRWSLALTAWLAATAAVGAAAEPPLRVGIEADLRPISFADEGGAPAGFAVDLLRAVARESGLELTFVMLPRTAMFAAFASGQVDALASVVHTRAREATMAFSVSHLELRSTIFQRAGTPPLRAAADLRSRRIAGIANSQSHEYLRARGWAQSFLPVQTVREMLHALAEGRAEATVATRLFAHEIIRQDHLTNIIDTDLELPDFTYRYYVVLHPEDVVRLARINEGLARLRASGAYDQIYEKWVGPLEPRPLRFKDVQPYLLPAVLLLVAVLGALLWQRRLLARLARQTEALRAGEEQLQLVLEGSTDGFWDWDMRTDRIKRSERWAAMLGYTTGEITPNFAGGRTLVHPDDLAAYDACQDQLNRGLCDHYQLEYRMQAKSGEWRWVLDRGKVVARGPGGAPLRMAGTHTDITARKHAEAERVQLQRKMLETQKLESLGLLAGGIAHDFNNLLTVVLAQLTLARLPGLEPGVAHDALGQIESAARRAADLCHQMLAYAGGRNLAMQHVDLDTLVRDLSALLRHSIGKDAHLEIVAGGPLPPVAADPSQLRQVLMNLVINAAEALGPAGGHIRVTTARRAPTADELRDAIHAPEPLPADCVCLSVDDDGCGMTPETRAKIFDPFFTTKFTGRGLGLAAVLGIVRAHGAVFCLRTAQGAGTTFAVFLPVAAPATTAAAPSAPDQPKPVPGHGTILVADDEAAVLAMSTLALKRQGYTVVTATDGEEAVARFRAAPGDFVAVVLDGTMPRLGGTAALEAIRALRPGLPAVLMSGFGAVEALERLPAGSRPVFLQKPFTHVELLERLAEALATAG